MSDLVCCYFEIKIDSGIDDIHEYDCSMGALPNSYIENDENLKSSLLLLYFFFNKHIESSEVLFIDKQGESWFFEADSQVDLGVKLSNSSGDKKFVISELRNFPKIYTAFWGVQTFQITAVKIIGQEHFDSLKGMYSPNFSI